MRQAAQQTLVTTSALNRNGAGIISDIFDIGVNYSGSFGGVEVNAGARYGTGNVNAATNPGVSDPETWGLGLSVGFAGVTVGGSYAENDNGGPGGIGGVGNASGADTSGWSLGIGYDAPGPWNFSVTTYQGYQDSAAGSNDYMAYSIGAVRNLGPGVNWNLYAVWTESDVQATAGTDLEGTIIGTSIGLSF